MQLVSSSCIILCSFTLGNPQALKPPTSRVFAKSGVRGLVKTERALMLVHKRKDSFWTSGFRDSAQVSPDSESVARFG